MEAIERPQSALGCMVRGYWLECLICASWRLVGGFHGLFIEMKTATGQQSKEQKALQLQLNNRGYLCTVARSAAEGFEMIKEYLNGEKLIG
jgi:hypothetical protein